MAKNIGFYQNFNLQLQELSAALQCVKAKPELSYEELGECMSLNPRKAGGLSPWLRHTGLVTTQVIVGQNRSLRYELTPFGQLAAQYDPFLNDLGTKWIIHYFLSTDHNERSEAWLVFINQFLTPGQSFSSDQFQTFFADVAGAEAQNRSAVAKDPKSVLYTYTQSKSLGQLGLLRKEKKNFISGDPNLPHILVIGYMLLDWWERKYPGTDTLHFSKLHQEPESLGRLCQVDVRQVKRFVSELTNLGYLNFAETQHEPVNRLHKEPPHTLLETYYTQR